MNRKEAKEIVETLTHEDWNEAGYIVKDTKAPIISLPKINFPNPLKYLISLHKWAEGSPSYSQDSNRAVIVGTVDVLILSLGIVVLCNLPTCIQSLIVCKHLLIELIFS